MEFEALLEAQFNDLPSSKVKEAMLYSLMAGGKRIRPNLMYEVVKGYGRNCADADPFACALEMIHTYSLIHDDLPAMDNDDLRRGRKTCHKQFNEATAILAGDGLLTYAFQTASKSTLAPSVVQKCIAVLAENAGPDGMVLGQCLDTEEETAASSWDELDRIHSLKTGCLLAAPLMIGALIADQSDDVVEEWKQIGIMLGVAFQIQDDILDVKLTAEEFGKSNSDARNEKHTSITLLGEEEAECLMKKLYDSSKGKIKAFKGFDSDDLIQMIDRIEKRMK